MITFYDIETQTIFTARVIVPNLTPAQARSLHEEWTKALESIAGPHGVIPENHMEIRQDFEKDCMVR